MQTQNASNNDPRIFYTHGEGNNFYNQTIIMNSPQFNINNTFIQQLSPLQNQSPYENSNSHINNNNNPKNREDFVAKNQNQKKEFIFESLDNNDPQNIYANNNEYVKKISTTIDYKVNSQSTVDHQNHDAQQIPNFSNYENINLDQYYLQPNVRSQNTRSVSLDNNHKLKGRFSNYPPTNQSNTNVEQIFQNTNYKRDLQNFNVSLEMSENYSIETINASKMKTEQNLRQFQPYFNTLDPYEKKTFKNNKVAGKTIQDINDNLREFNDDQLIDINGSKYYEIYGNQNDQSPEDIIFQINKQKELQQIYGSQLKRISNKLVPRPPPQINQLTSNDRGSKSVSRHQSLLKRRNIKNSNHNTKNLSFAQTKQYETLNVHNFIKANGQLSGHFNNNNSLDASKRHNFLTIGNHEKINSGQNQNLSLDASNNQNHIHNQHLHHRPYPMINREQFQIMNEQNIRIKGTEGSVIMRPPQQQLQLDPYDSNPSPFPNQIVNNSRDQSREKAPQIQKPEYDIVYHNRPSPPSRAIPPNQPKSGNLNQEGNDEAERKNQSNGRSRAFQQVNQDSNHGRSKAPQLHIHQMIDNFKKQKINNEHSKEVADIGEIEQVVNVKNYMENFFDYDILNDRNSSSKQSGPSFNPYQNINYLIENRGHPIENVPSIAPIAQQLTFSFNSQFNPNRSFQDFSNKNILQDPNCNNNDQLIQIQCNDGKKNESVISQEFCESPFIRDYMAPNESKSLMNDNYLNDQLREPVMDAHELKNNRTIHHSSNLAPSNIPSECNTPDPFLLPKASYSSKQESLYREPSPPPPPVVQENNKSEKPKIFQRHNFKQDKPNYMSAEDPDLQIDEMAFDHNILQIFSQNDNTDQIQVPQISDDHRIQVEESQKNLLEDGDLQSIGSSKQFEQENSTQLDQPWQEGQEQKNSPSSFSKKRFNSKQNQQKNNYDKLLVSSLQDYLNKHDTELSQKNGDLSLYLSQPTLAENTAANLSDQKSEHDFEFQMKSFDSEDTNQRTIESHDQFNAIKEKDPNAYSSKKRKENTTIDVLNRETLLNEINRKFAANSNNNQFKQNVNLQQAVNILNYHNDANSINPVSNELFDQLIKDQNEYFEHDDQENDFFQINNSVQRQLFKQPEFGGNMVNENFSFKTQNENNQDRGYQIKHSLSPNFQNNTSSNSSLQGQLDIFDVYNQNLANDQNDHQSSFEISLDESKKRIKKQSNNANSDNQKLTEADQNFINFLEENMSIIRN